MICTSVNRLEVLCLPILATVIDMSNLNVQCKCVSLLSYCISSYANKGQVLKAACQRRQIKRTYGFPLKLRKCQRSLRTEGTMLCLLGDVEKPQVSHIFSHVLGRYQLRLSASIMLSEEISWFQSGKFEKSFLKGFAICKCFICNYLCTSQKGQVMLSTLLLLL